MAWPCHSFVDGLSEKCINVYFKKKKKRKRHLINNDCLTILVPYTMLAYLMLFAALFNAVCLYDAFSCHCAIMLCLGLFQILYCIMHISFSLLVFLIIYALRLLFLIDRAMCSLEK